MLSYTFAIAAAWVVLLVRDAPRLYVLASSVLILGCLPCSLCFVSLGHSAKARGTIKLAWTYVVWLVAKAFPQSVTITNCYLLLWLELVNLIGLAWWGLRRRTPTFVTFQCFWRIGWVPNPALLVSLLLQGCLFFFHISFGYASLVWRAKPSWRWPCQSWASTHTEFVCILQWIWWSGAWRLTTLPSGMSTYRWPTQAFAQQRETALTGTVESPCGKTISSDTCYGSHCADVAGEEGMFHSTSLAHYECMDQIQVPWTANRVEKSLIECIMLLALAIMYSSIRHRRIGRTKGKSSSSSTKRFSWSQWKLGCASGISCIVFSYMCITVYF